MSTKPRRPAGDSTVINRYTARGGNMLAAAFFVLGIVAAALQKERNGVRSGNNRYTLQ
jgi:hypothetical protein